MWDDGINADVQAFKSKLGELKTLTKSLMIRVKETDLRPKKIAELNEIVNTTQHFLRGAQRLFEAAEEDDKPLTSTDLKSLEKILDETKTWRENVLSEFEKLLPTEDPKYLSTDFDMKIDLLARETKYLLNKVQRYVPKQKTTTTTTAKPTTTTEPSKTDDEQNRSTTKTEETETTTVSTAESEKQSETNEKRVDL